VSVSLGLRFAWWRRRGETSRRRGLTAFESHVRRHRLAWSTGLTTVTVLDQLILWGWRLADWDWLLTSGAVLFAWLYPVSLLLPDRVDVTIRRLVESSGVASAHTNRTGDSDPDTAADSVIEPFDLPSVVDDLHARAQVYAARGGPLLATAMALGWLAAKRSEFLSYAPLIVAETAGAYLVGMFVGRAVAYGGLGRHLARRGLDLQSQPGHLDGAAGLRPVGELFIYNASLIAVLALYLGVWWLAFPHLDRYPDWRRSYAGYFAVVVAAEVLSFFTPLLWFHRKMSQRKRELLAEGDGLAHQVLVLQGQWLTAADDQERTALTARMTYLTTRYQEIQQMPTWPVDTRVRRRFAVNNLLVLSPVLLQFLGIPDRWSTLWSSVAGTIGGQG
jgi:hypothetical protein